MTRRLRPDIGKERTRREDQFDRLRLRQRNPDRRSGGSNQVCRRTHRCAAPAGPVPGEGDEDPGSVCEGNRRRAFLSSAATRSASSSAGTAASTPGHGCWFRCCRRTANGGFSPVFQACSFWRHGSENPGRTGGSAPPTGWTVTRCGRSATGRRSFSSPEESSDRPSSAAAHRSRARYALRCCGGAARQPGGANHPGKCRGAFQNRVFSAQLHAGGSSAPETAPHTRSSGFGI